jgi:hypothetical protein
LKELKEIEINDFQTMVYNHSYMSENYRLLPNDEGFIKNKDTVVLFKWDNYSKWLDEYKNVKLFSMSKEQFLEYSDKLKQDDTLKFWHIVNVGTMLNCTNEYFELKGKRHAQMRKYYNRYNKNSDVVVKTEPNSIQEVFDLIEKWKKQTDHFRYVTGYDKNFIKNQVKNYKDCMITLYFYIKGELVAYSIVERCDKNLYNFLFRKTTKDHKNLCNYVDFYTLKYIHDEINEPFILNFGGDMGDKNLVKYKTNFKLEHGHIDMYDIKIMKKPKKNHKLF